MNSDDNNQNNITWTPQRSASTNDAGQEETSLPQGQSFHKDVAPLFPEASQEKEFSLDSLREEIDGAFQNTESTEIPLKRNDPLADPSPPVSSETSPFYHNTESTDFPIPPFTPTETMESNEIQRDVMMDDHDTLMNDLRTSIDSDFESKEEEIERGKGVENTYYGDVSGAMESNDPKTMSELIQKARFEEEELKIISPRSKKNLFFIGGALLLIIFSIGILSFLFGGSGRSVQFISGERVASLVYSNQDTGINVTGLQPAQTRQAIRKAVEIKIPRDTINQIYYAEEVGGNVMRRLSIGEIFHKTENVPPELLMSALDDTFMHGVYSTDRNYPFLILKTNSYDRAYEGMKEWEPTMIDDLATYFDLPPEANDRSLVESGFEDDLIRNKNVRVARFLPREADRRGIFRIFDSLGINRDGTTNEALAPELPAPQEERETIGGDGVLGFLERHLASRVTPSVAYAQTEGSWDFGQTQGGGTQLVCYNNSFPGQVFPAEYQNTPGYYCVTVLTGEGAIGQITVTEPICFDIITGQRIQEGGNPMVDFCFAPYRCNRYACYQGNTEVNSNREGEPGVVCRETNEGVTHDSPVRKICRQFNDLVMLQNINNANLCFDQNGRYLPNVTQSDGSMQGVTCIVPQNRTSALCMTTNGQIYDPSGPDAPFYDANRKFCFQRLDTSMTGIGVNDRCADLTVSEIQAKLAAAAQELRFIALLAGAVGVSNQDVQNMNEFADFLMDLAQQNVLQIDMVRQAAFYLEQLEQILDALDPYGELLQTGPNGGLNVYGVLRTIIDTVKCALGIANNLQWITLGQLEPNLFIFAGQSLPQMIPIQQSLVLMGLMDPVSVTGTLDLVTQDAISQFQLANGLNITGTINPETILIINGIIEGNGSLYGGEAIINDYFLVPGGTLGGGGTLSGGEPLGGGGIPIALGSYLNAVQNLQIILYAEGYNILNINGLFDADTCAALQMFQEDNGLEIADDTTCTVSAETLEYLNDLIRENGYLGTGFYLNPQGFLEGTGVLEGTFGPGVFDYTVSEADADTLREGDIVLMYMFLDEQTILITRNQVVIDEVIRRRALSDIFQ